MSTAKKPVSAPVEDLRIFTDFFGDEEKAIVTKWLTPELATTAVTTLSNLLAVLALVGWLHSSDVETLTKAVAALIGASEVIVVNSLLIWKLISGRLELKSQMLRMKYQYVESVTIERMRAS
jgi:hypothetical protein